MDTIGRAEVQARIDCSRTNGQALSFEVSRRFTGQTAQNQEFDRVDRSLTSAIAQKQSAQPQRGRIHEDVRGALTPFDEVLRVLQCPDRLLPATFDAAEVQTKFRLG